MTTFNYDITDGDVSFEGLDSGDTLNITGGISDQDFSFLKDDDDLLIYTSAGTTIRLTNHFANNNSQIETISVAGAGTIDLTNPHIVVSDGTSNMLYGDSNDNLILGGKNGDVLYAYDGDDIVYGGDKTDQIFVGSGDDIAYGGGGNDTFYDGGSGDDEYYGGSGGINGVSYDANSTGVNADLSAGTVDDDGDSTTDDLLFDINRIKGSQHDDELYGASTRDYFDGNDGDDLIYGYNGNDNLNGENGDDTIYGGNGNDYITGGLGTNTLYGEDGNDTFAKRSNINGNDTIDGGGGVDQLDYRFFFQGATVDLSTGTADSDGDGITDITMTSIENVTGSNHADNITGDTNTNNLTGEGGNDILNGEGGYDILNGKNGDDTLYGSAGEDLLYGGTGADTFIFDDIDDYANDQSNTVADFNENEDFLDISEILDGVVFTILAPIANYIDVIDDGTDTTIRIDDVGTGLNYTDTVFIQGYTGHGHNAQDMINEGYLIV